jgi:hypothetical protein
MSLVRSAAALVLLTLLSSALPIALRREACALSAFVVGSFARTWTARPAVRARCVGVEGCFAAFGQVVLVLEGQDGLIDDAAGAFVVEELAVRVDVMARGART